MAQYSNDGTGIIRVVSDQDVVEFDRDASVNRSGWSTRVPAVASRFKNITERTGKADTKHA